MEEMSLAALIVLAVAMGAVGALTGFLAGLLGIGGGALLVPVLYEAFTLYGVDEAVRMQVTLGTVLGVIAPTAMRSFAGHHARGSADMSVIRRMGPWVVAGVIVGVVIARDASSTALQAVWAVCGSLLALKMAFGREDWRLGDDIPRGWLTEAIASVIGIASALMSIGGGAFMTAFLTLYGRPILSAVATSSGFGPLIAVPGTIGVIWAGWDAQGLPPFTLGYVNFLAVALIIPASLLTAPIGVRLAHAFSRRQLELAFATFLFFVAARFLYAVFT